MDFPLLPALDSIVIHNIKELTSLSLEGCQFIHLHHMCVNDEYVSVDCAHVPVFVDSSCRITSEQKVFASIFFIVAQLGIKKFRVLGTTDIFDGDSRFSSRFCVVLGSTISLWNKHLEVAHD